MANIIPKKRHGLTIGYIADLGGRDADGNRQRKFHKTVEEAQAWIDLNYVDPLGTALLFENKDEVLFCLKRLKEVNATINEATDFYLEFGAMKTNPATQDAVESLLTRLLETDRKPKYVDGLRHVYKAFMAVIGAETKMLEITQEKIFNYVYKHNLEWSPVTRRDIIRNLNVLFNYAVRQHFIGINPIAGIALPQMKYDEPAVMSPEHFQLILDKCLKKGWYDRLVIFVLVAFCGVRKEEAAKLLWSNIDLTNRSVIVTATASKTGIYRRNTIPDNAMDWFNLIKDGRLVGTDSHIIGDNWISLMRSAVRFAKITYDQNCLRHSFCSYAIEAGWDKQTVIEMMGHTGPQTIKKHYRKILDPAIAAKWWNIQPPKAA